METCRSDEVIDVVPRAAYAWVLAVSREAAEFHPEGNDDALRHEGMRLYGEWEQGEAHSARSRTRAAI